jgi:peptide/nickel transport system permease protein
MKSLTRIVLVFSLVWIASRTAIYLLPGDPADFLVHESLVKIDASELRNRMELEKSPAARILSLPGSRSLVRNEEVLPRILRAWEKTALLATLSSGIAIALTFLLLFLNFQGGNRRSFARMIGLGLASIPVVVLGPLFLRFLPLPNPFLPAMVLGGYLAAFWYRSLARRLEKQIPSSPVAGARALGFPEIDIFTRNHLAPELGGFLAFFGSQLGFLLNGSILVETLFQWNGIGTLLSDAILARDYPVLETGMMTAALLTLLSQQAGYALQSWWDPRIT